MEVEDEQMQIKSLILPEITNLAEKYINAHCNPTLKLEPFGYKLFIPSPDEDEQHQSECISRVETILRHDLVDRRCARSKAVWLPDENLTLVKKIVGSLANYGYQNKRGKFLSVEETMVLLEINKLELLYHDIPLSIQEVHKYVLSNLQNGLQNYLAYKKLVLQGYRLKVPRENKELEAVPTKKRRIEQNRESEENSEDIFIDVFRKLREKGPQPYLSNDRDTKPSYYVNFVNTTGKISPDFNLIIKSTNDEFPSPKMNKASDVYSLCSDDSVAFYQFLSGPIPNL